MLTKSRIILLGVMIVMVAISAIPIFSPSASFSSDSESNPAQSDGSDSEGIVFTNGFEAASANAAAHPSAPTPSGGSALVQELERALARLEQLTPRRIEAPRPVQIPVSTPAPAPSSSETPIAAPALTPQPTPPPVVDLELQAREQLRSFLERHPIRGCIRGNADDLLLLEGLRLRLGESLGASPWTLVEMNEQGLLLACGEWRARIAWPTAPLPLPKTQAPQEEAQ